MGNVGSTPINNSSDEGSMRLELAVLCEIKHVIEPLLKTLSPRGIPQLADSHVGPEGNGNSSNGSTTTVSVSKEEQELLVIRIIERFMPLFADRVQEVIKEKIPSVVEMSWTRMNQYSGDRVNSSEPRNLEIKFLNKPALLVLTGRHIKGEDGSSIKIALIDVITGDVVKSGPEASEKVEIAVLRVDPDGDEGHDWTPVEFKLHIVTERKANLRKNAFVKLKEGMGLIGEIYFPNRKIWTKKCQLRLGARIDSTFNGMRVKEAKSEPFTLEDCRNKRDKKHGLSSLSGEILGKGMSDKALNKTVEHGLKCIPDDNHLYYHPGSQPITGVVSNDVGQVMGRLVESNYVPVADLSENKKAAQKLVESAFEHCGDESSSNSLQIPSVPNVGTSHIVAGTDDPQPSIAPMVSTSDLITAYEPQPIPSYPGTISASDSIGMETLYSHNSSEGCLLYEYLLSEVPGQTFPELMEFDNFDKPYTGQQTSENGSLCAGTDRAVPIDNAQSRRGTKMGHALIYAMIFSLRIKVVHSESVRKRQRLY